MRCRVGAVLGFLSPQKSHLGSRTQTAVFHYSFWYNLQGEKKIKEVHLSCFINHNRCFQFREILFKKIFLSFTIQFVFLILCYESNQKMLYWLFLYKTDHKMI